MAGVDAELLRVPNGPEYLRRLKEFLGGDATAVETRAADARFLDERDVETGGGSVERRRVPARSATNDG